mgnify:CR=1 FL=1
MLGYYGIVLGQKDDPNDGNGIGRVIREIHKDGSFGNIYFLRYNHRFNESNTNYPFYKSSKDAGFVKKEELESLKRRIAELENQISNITC